MLPGSRSIGRDLGAIARTTSGTSGGSWRVTVTTASRLVRALGIAVFGALLLPAAALAAPPEHSPAFPPDLVLPGGDICEHDVLLATPSGHLRDSAYAPLPDGTTRFTERGMAATTATDLTTGAVFRTRGGSSIVYRFAADDSLVVTGTGWIFVWYLPADDADVGPGLFLIHGRVQERYASDGTFVSSRTTGNALDVCEALGD